MVRDTTVRVLSIPPSFAREATEYALRDVFSHFDPDAVFVPSHAPDRRAQSALARVADDRPLLVPGDPTRGGGLVSLPPTDSGERHDESDSGSERGPDSDPGSDSGPGPEPEPGSEPKSVSEPEPKSVSEPRSEIELDESAIRPQLFVAPDVETLSTVSDHEREGSLDPRTETYVLSNLLDVSLDTTTLSASLEGQPVYEAALADATGHYTHVSGVLPSDYRRDWDGFVVHGAGGGEGGTGGTAGGDSYQLTCLTLAADGTVSTETVRTTRLGLRALSGVGARRARALRSAGFRTREAVAKASPADIAAIDGFGESVAQSVSQAATAMAEGRVVYTGDGALPEADPVFIDIETDGLAPSAIWLIGVLDAATGDYTRFRQRDPDDPGEPVEAFAAWYAANARGRPVVAYNGWGFDFEALHDQIVDHCPSYRDLWTATYRFDPYEWAVKDGNAILPGLTNRLGDVATALGWDGDDTGLDGATVARRYREWVADPVKIDPDWDAYETYCEDDVRSLAYVYDAIDDAGRLLGGGRSRQRDAGRQGSLTEW
ncbi:ribonuclease H-like domain-containing protein [Haloarchaeobius sp. DFWS5]|uniref:ribonuclease H-like domain-containing protein n=1 Tax=Haloarchaeobius sp. DFWS5 TaxID=3446114 RepID=UPI003EBBF512